MNNPSLTHSLLFNKTFYPPFSSSTTAAAGGSVCHKQELISECLSVVVKYVTACKKLDHYGSVAATLKMKKLGYTDLNDYTLTRSEYAKSIGVSPNCVRMRMRHGKLDGQYRFDGSKFLFKPSNRPREYIANDHSNNIKMTTSKKKYNRGNHFKADYPNQAFKNYNELKMYNKIKKNLPDKVLNEINPEVIKVAEERAKKKIDDLQKSAFTPLKDYGGPVSMRYQSYDRERFKEDLSSSSFNPHHNRNYYDMGGYDDGSVEVDVSRSNRTPTFKNKIEEEVYYHPNNKKK